MGQKIDLTTQVQGILPVVNGGAGQIAGLQFSDAEVPGGAVNGSNGSFTLANTPSPPASLLLFVRLPSQSAQLQIQGVDYTLVGNTLNIAPPPTGAKIYAWYRFIGLVSSVISGDALQLTDSFIFDMPAAQLPVGISDSLIMSDQLLSIFASKTALAITEAMTTMNDKMVQFLGPFTLQVADALAMNDAAVLATTGVLTLSDRIALVDMLMYRTPTQFNPQEQMSQSDSIILLVAVSNSFAEQLTLADAVTVQLR
jgi:hypothetical protein